MLTEAQLNELLAIFLERSQSVVEEYLIRMGDQIREIGELIPSSINRLVQLKKMNANLDAIKREIARLAEISAEDLQRVFEAAQETDARFVAATFGNTFQPSILENAALKQLLAAQLEVTFGQMRNLSQTTIKSDAYRNVVDKAIQAAQMGVEDYNKSIRRALEETAGEGLKVEIGNTGAYETRIGYGGKYTRRLDSAIRQNVLDGIRSLSNATLMQLGEEFGADGIEISAHMLCAEDHLPYQGKQYSMRKFDEIQESLPRPFGMWNCKHSMHPILLGISEPAYSDEELEEYRKFSSEQITIDGVTKSRYQWTQEQRRIETAVRRQKDVSVCARAAGNGPLRRDAQRTINTLMDRYDKVTEAAGLRTEYDRMRVAGFKHTSEKELKKSEKSDTINLKRRIVVSGAYIKPMPKYQVQRIAKAFSKNGGVIQMGVETDRHLDGMRAQGSTLAAGIILLHTNPSRATVFEELIHSTQYKKGMNDGTPLSAARCEIEAKEKLLKYAEAYRLTKAEIREAKLLLKQDKANLERMKKGK